MTTLQEYLNNLKEKEQVGEIDIRQINKERENSGNTDLLEGGGLDLKEFKSLVRISIDNQFLKTPLLKVEVSGLTKLKDLVWKGEEDSEEDKKIFEELGIIDNQFKKGIVREIKSLSKLIADKKINVFFSTTKSPKEQIKEGIVGITEQKDNEYNVYLQLERLDKQGQFAPILVLWTFAQELTGIKFPKYDKDPLYWNHFWNEELTWIKSNASKIYQNDLELLSFPSKFPYQKFEIKDIHAVYYPTLENDSQVQTIFYVDLGIVDKTWKIIREELIELIAKEVKKASSDEERVGLTTGFRIWLYDPDKSVFSFRITHRSKTPILKKMEEIYILTPLKVKVEDLKKKKEQMPTPENFIKLNRENSELKGHLKDHTDKKEFEDIMNKIDKVD